MNFENVVYFKIEVSTQEYQILNEIKMEADMIFHINNKIGIICFYHSGRKFNSTSVAFLYCIYLRINYMYHQ